MRTPFFSTESRIQLLRSEAESWLRTPFRKGCRVKGAGGGVDCVGLNIACYEAAGFVAAGAITVPDYDVEHYEYSDVSQLEEWFRSEEVRNRMAYGDRDDPLAPGDTVFIRHRRAVHHVALWDGIHLWFTMRGQGVMNLRIEALKSVGAELRSHFRPVEL